MIFKSVINEGYSELDQLTQKELVLHYFPSCRVRHRGLVLIVEFIISDEDFQSQYNIQIRYVSQKLQGVYIEKPSIKPSIGIHMYPDKRLCLYYPPDISPFRRIWIATDLIPLTIKWVYHYELWLVNGNKWMGREAPRHQQLMWLRA